MRQPPSFSCAVYTTLLVTSLLASSFLPFRGAWAQVNRDAPLFREMMAMDSLLFVEGFNRCALEVLDRIVADDLEFYHDQAGIQDRPQFMEAVRQNICSSPRRKPIRKLVPGSVKVFPLHRDGALYGAIQFGRHEFYIREPGRELHKTSVAQFTHVWIRDGEKWRLAEVLSYDHRDPSPSS